MVGSDGDTERMIGCSIGGQIPYSIIAFETVGTDTPRNWAIWVVDLCCVAHSSHSWSMATFGRPRLPVWMEEIGCGAPKFDAACNDRFPP